MSQRPTILIVDDERHTREGLARALRGDYAVAEAENGQRALEWLETHAADVILTDLRMPHMDGLQLLARLLGREPKPIVIMLTAYGNVETAVEAMKRGAYDFLAKPVNLDRLELLLTRALAERQLGVENQRLRAQLDSKYGFANIIGTSPAMQAVFDTIRHVAPTKATVLIQGESGTGKELVARALHQASPRREGPFVPVHCAALAPTLLESELFGHEKGAFTGAVERRRGRFEMADGGTLFLDEIGEIEPSLQVKILRVLEERAFERVGGSETVTVNVRLVAATNKDLRQLVADGKFREDLFYRLFVVNLTLPPLRERDGDIVLLTQHYLKTLAAENGKSVPTLTAEAMDALTAYSWPGNVRELRNVIERMVVLNSTGKLNLDDVPATVRQGAHDSGRDATRAGRVLRDAERQLIEDALRQHRGNRTKAAQHLGISRRTLHRKLNEFGLRSRSND
ncbi:MAG TPA: sigma-54 dependent transcriptional regulator [Kiritimatiellia bacterium]|jgi:DNA-binding NtrC family response regulator|nr:sigma-54-dependent Fis family transcriptional regulator [Kiritimatiellia bacterium]OQC56001.1 MAG: Transcriptional regulatory protein ZraR [Verrucomicrobia bacterium ADurb.Bin018]MBP9572679.1 sigma-54-dependent Fis family transcriptional regulator [Kiritimatiellia bacterium]HOE01037.1 sigma-54 dependent transcriptional regulator [Kiritimatiellia bacterium]HOU59699.1 sigma-54 dependent transcriptional regulator [Kiritimatiellia bacterium]